MLRLALARTNVAPLLLLYARSRTETRSFHRRSIPIASSSSDRPTLTINCSSRKIMIRWHLGSASDFSLGSGELPRCSAKIGTSATTVVEPADSPFANRPCKR